MIDFFFLCLSVFCCFVLFFFFFFFFFFQAEDGIRDGTVTGVQTCALPIYLLRRVLGVGAVARQRRQLVDRVRRLLPRQRRLHQPVRDEVRKAPVRRGGMRVVLHRQAEMPDGLLSRFLQHVLARSHGLDDGQRQI